MSMPGSRVILSNTFGANRYVLSKFGLADKVAEINIAAWRFPAGQPAAGHTYSHPWDLPANSSPQKKLLKPTLNRPLKSRHRQLKGWG